MIDTWTWDLAKLLKKFGFCFRLWRPGLLTLRLWLRLWRLKPGNKMTIVMINLIGLTVK